MAKINYKSDFDFILTLRDAQGNDIGFPNFNWEARFWTFSPMCAMTASCHDGECVNCFNDSDKIHVVINAPTLGCGKLRVELVTHRENSIYPDGERTLYTPDVLDIELVSGKGDTEVTAEAGIVVPTADGTKIQPRIEVKVWEEGYIAGGEKPTEVEHIFAYSTHSRISTQDISRYCCTNACATGHIVRKEEMNGGLCVPRAGTFVEARRHCG